jgi:hypothetical protein
MALFEDMFKGGNIVTGVAIAVGAAVIVPLVAPAVGGMLRPLAKAVIKGGLVAYDYGRQAVAQAGEMASDLTAEVRAEANQAAAEAGGSGTAGTSGVSPETKPA